jgi:hypothetical protein
MRRGRDGALVHGREMLKCFVSRQALILILDLSH